MKIKSKNEIIDLDKISTLNITKLDENNFRQSIDGRHVNCFVTEDDNLIHVFIEGSSFSFEKVKADADFGMASEGSKSGREEIKPPMPGSVVKLLVEDGQKVEEGDGLIIVEAMKMETTIYSSISGVVKEINAEPAQQVDANKVLMVVEKEE